MKDINWERKIFQLFVMDEAFMFLCLFERLSSTLQLLSYYRYSDVLAIDFIISDKFDWMDRLNCLLKRTSKRTRD